MIIQVTRITIYVCRENWQMPTAQRVQWREDEKSEMRKKNCVNTFDAVMYLFLNGSIFIVHCNRFVSSNFDVTIDSVCVYARATHNEAIGCGSLCLDAGRMDHYYPITYLVSHSVSN